MTSYQAAMNECLYNLENIRKDHHKLQVTLDHAYEKADRVKEKMLPFYNRITQNQDKIKGLQDFVKSRQEELKASEASFNGQVALIDRQNRQHVKSYWVQRIKEWNNRWTYFRALRTMAGIDGEGDRA
jgi:predicted  nucleic acid-binding Zn-ribbon protein